MKLDKIDPRSRITTTSNDRAVSPVIGVILMVAITVVLAAVIGVFVIGLGDEVSSTAPSVTLEIVDEGSGNTVTISHDGGDTLNLAEDMTILANGSAAVEPGDWAHGDDELEPGESTDENVGTNQTTTIAIRHDPSGTIVAEEEVDIS